VALAGLFALSAVACRLQVVPKAYGIVRIGIVLVSLVASAELVRSDRVRSQSKALLVSAIAMVFLSDVFQVETVDRKVYDATKQTVSGHALKHVCAGVGMALLTFFYTRNFIRPP
jgi:uncharacterized membrane protein